MQERGTDSPLSRPALRAWSAVALVGAIAVGIDQVTKTWAENVLATRSPSLGPLQFVLVRNEGIAFGLASGFASILVPLTIAVLVVVLVRSRTRFDRPTILSVGLVLGGAVGNLIDRLFRDTGGAVVDFIKVAKLPVLGLEWPVFNLADVCVVTGVIVLMLLSARRNTEEE